MTSSSRKWHQHFWFALNNPNILWCFVVLLWFTLQWCCKGNDSKSELHSKCVTTQRKNDSVWIGSTWFVREDMKYVAFAHAVCKHPGCRFSPIHCSLKGEWVSGAVWRASGEELPSSLLQFLYFLQTVAVLRFSLTVSCAGPLRMTNTSVKLRKSPSAFSFIDIQ